MLRFSRANHLPFVLIRGGCTFDGVYNTYFVFTCMPGESYSRRLRSFLLCLCDVFRALINSLLCSFCTRALGLVPFQIYEYWHKGDTERISCLFPLGSRATCLCSSTFCSFSLVCHCVIFFVFLYSWYFVSTVYVNVT